MPPSLWSVLSSVQVLALLLLLFVPSPLVWFVPLPLAGVGLLLGLPLQLALVLRRCMPALHAGAARRWPTVRIADFLFLSIRTVDKEIHTGRTAIDSEEAQLLACMPCPPFDHQESIARRVGTRISFTHLSCTNLLGYALSMRKDDHHMPFLFVLLRQDTASWIDLSAG